MIFFFAQKKIIRSIQMNSIIDVLTHH